jgi:hypothetical protein
VKNIKTRQKSKDRKNEVGKNRGELKEKDGRGEYKEEVEVEYETMEKEEKKR